jgi:hypothetical protein
VYPKIDAPGTAGDELFTCAEAVKFLRICQANFFNILRTGAIPSIRQGKRRFFWRSDLVNYLNRHRVGSADAE